jgi:hypothetical protein
MFHLGAVKETGCKELPQREGGLVELPVSRSDPGPGQGVEFAVKRGSTAGTSAEDQGCLVLIPM